MSTSTISQAYETGKYLVNRLAIAAALVIWSGFWLAVVRLHMIQGNATGAVITTLLTLVPVVAVAVRTVPSVDVFDLWSTGSEPAAEST